MKWGQFHKSRYKGNHPIGMSHLMHSTWHIPNNEVMVITVSYSKTMSENSLGKMPTDLIALRPSALSSKS